MPARSYVAPDSPAPAVASPSKTAWAPPPAVATAAGTTKHGFKQATRKVRAASTVHSLRKSFATPRIWGDPGAAQVVSDLKDFKSASALERFRDAVLKRMAAWEPLFGAVALVGGIGLVAFALLLVVLLFPVQMGVGMGSMTELIEQACNLSQYNQSAPAGTYGHIEFRGSSQYPPRVRGVGTITEFGNDYYVARACTRAQVWFNVCIKYFTFYFGYINLLQLPWTLSIFANTRCPRKGAPEVGVDFYGRPSESLWFNLPRSTRSLVAALLLFSLVAQTIALVFHLTWLSYLAGQTFPGALLQNVWVPLQLGAQIAASNVQAKAEARARLAHPGRFAPTIGTYIKQAFTRWRAAVKESGKRSMLCCGESSFVSFVLAEVREFNKEAAKFGAVGGLSGVHKEAIDNAADVRRDVPA